MTVIRQRVHSELPSGDPALLNRIAWARRWTERAVSTENAREARKLALDGSGKRSSVEQGLALRTLGWQAMWRGELDEAMNFCLRAESFLPESAQREARAHIYSILAIVHYARGRIDLATCAIERGLWLMRYNNEGHSALTIADLLMTRATIQRIAGERARAGITISRAREKATGELVPVIDQMTARWLSADGKAKTAHEHAQRALDASEALGNQVILPYCHAAVGASHTRARAFDKARAAFGRAYKIVGNDKDKRALCQLSRDMARLEHASGNVAEAQRHLAAGAKLAKKQAFSLWRKKIALDQASCFEELGDFKSANEQHKLAWRLQDEMRNR